MDFSKYKGRLREFASLNGADTSKHGNIRCFLPTHGGDDLRPSLSIRDDSFKCYACGAAGDIYDMVEILKGISEKGEQFKYIESVFDGSVAIPKRKKKKSEAIDSDAAEKLTSYLRDKAKENREYLLEFAESRGYGESFASRLGYWPGYKIAKEEIGQDILEKAMLPVPGKRSGKAWKPPGAVMKFNRGWKLMYLRDGKTIKRASYSAKTFPYPAPPKGSDIVIVEAEISALAGRLNGIPMVACGGVNGIGKNDIDILNAYEKLTICFDADEAGISSSEKLSNTLLDAGYKGDIYIASLAVNDWGNDPDDYIKSGNLENLKYIIDKAVKFKRADRDISERSESLPFRYLGFSEASHYFMDRKDMITKSPAGKLTSGILLEIAPLSFWQTVKPKRDGNPDWTFIFDLIIAESVKVGPYKKTKIRGVGVWEDNGEIIASDGEYIIHSSGRTPVREYESKYTYIRRAQLGIDSVENKRWEKDRDFLIWISETLSFLTPEDGKILFGWVISSLFISVLNWRPIVYMKGPTSAGKSWTMNDIVRPILGELCIAPSKTSTVKGIMQAPGRDARPVTVDELEQSNSRKSQDLITDLMILARDTTTKSHESRYVGTADQEGMSSDFESMFLFASIVEASEEDQDVNRITSVNFIKRHIDNFSEFEAKVRYEFSNGFGERIRHNAIFHRESIVNNIKIFRKVSAARAGAQRNGDQLGTLIAGWYHIDNPGHVVNEDEATEYIKQFDFSEQEERAKGKTMEVIMTPIMSYVVRYEETEYTRSGGEKIIKREQTVYALLREMFVESDNSPRSDINRALMNHGIRYGSKKNPKYVIIAQNHHAVKRMLPDDFPYKSNYHDYLKNHPAYRGKEKSVRFNGVVHQGLLFSMNLAEEGEEDMFTDNIPF